MSLIRQGRTSTGLEEAATAFWSAVFVRSCERVRAYWRFQRERRQLLDYLASDYRAAADIGITSSEARGLSQKPFWRA